MQDAIVLNLPLTPISTLESVTESGVHGTRVRGRDREDYLLAPRYSGSLRLVNGGFASTTDVSICRSGIVQ